MTEHTPGPWKIDSGAKSPGIMIAAGSIIHGGGYMQVATVHKGWPGGSVAQANARLIAAAPDAIAVCERVAAFFEGSDAPLGEAARAAIAKSKESDHAP